LALSLLHFHEESLWSKYGCSFREFRPAFCVKQKRFNNTFEKTWTSGMAQKHGKWEPNFGTTFFLILAEKIGIFDPQKQQSISQGPFY